MDKLRMLLAILIAAALLPVAAHAQQGATVTGRVTDANGVPVASASVRIPTLNIGTTTDA